MIVVLKPQVTEEKRDELISWFKELGLGVHVSVGKFQTILGLIGDTATVDMDLIGSLDIVDSVKQITESF
ncbi:MAG: 3-deoxy-7-phosphoheptulonate synthase, partial [Lachnospiraceae bacterium]|nr:3-deoxy-7-phosphoheptulonate synthase [Lachnospiraceae bacterium]